MSSSRTHDLASDLDLARHAITEAGRVVMRSFRTHQEVRHKSPDQPVTDADLAADALLRDRLGVARPGYGWLSEESEASADRLDRRRVWVVDPVDGTRSFIQGYAEFALSVALVEGDAVVMGVLHNPARDELFWAVRGDGAFDADGTRLAVRGPDDSPLTLLASRSEIARGELAPFRPDFEIRPLGSTAYKLAGVAAGDAHGYISRGPKSEWDLAAAALLVVEAGGRVSDIGGRPLRFNQPDPRIEGVISGSPDVHGRLVERARGLAGPGR